MPTSPRPAAALFLILAASLAIGSATTAKASDAQRRTLTVTGHGEVSAAPDMATIDIGVVSDGDTARAALDENTAAMARIMEVVGSSEIKDKDVQTSGFRVQPRTFHDPRQHEPPRVSGYRVSNTVHVRVRDLARLGAVLDAVVTGGSNSIRGLVLSFSDPSSLMDEARRKAGADARHKAELYAQGLGIELKEIVSVSEAGGGPAPMPMMMRAAAMEAADVPIAAGEQAVSASLSVTWEIK